MRAGRKDTSHPIVERRSHSEIARRAASADIEAVQYALRASAGWLCERSPNRMKRQRPGTRAYMMRRTPALYGCALNADRRSDIENK